MTAPTPPVPAAFEQADIGRAALWFGFAGGLVAWLGHFLLAYAISEFGCVAGWGKIHWAGLSAITWALAGATALAIALATASILIALRTHRRLRDEPGAGAGHWMGWAGLIAGGLSLLTILVESIPIFYWLGDC